MIRRLSGLLLMCSVLCLSRSSGALGRGSFNVGAVDIEVLQGYPEGTHSAFVGVTFGVVIDNRGSDRSVRLSVEGPVGTTRTVRVARGDRQRMFFHLPRFVGHSYVNRRLHITDLTSGEDRQIPIETHAAGIATARMGTLASAVNVQEPVSDLGDVEPYWPDDWRGLSGLAAIVVDNDHLRAAADKHALLRDWVAQGGVLFVLTASERFESAGVGPLWRVLDSAAFALQPCSASGGADCSRPKPHAAGQVDERRVVRGAIVYATPDALSVLDADLANITRQWRVAREATTDAGGQLTSMLGEGVVPDGKPTGAMFWVLVAFAGLAGPGGWYWLVRRQKRPLRYLLLVLGSSVTFSAALLATDFVQYGLVARGRTSTLVIVDQRAGKEIGIADAVVVAPTFIGTELTAPENAELLLGLQHESYTQERELKQRAGRQEVARGFEQRRASAVGSHWVGPMEGRLLVEPDGQGLSVENHLGVFVTELRLWRDGALYELHALTPGERRLLGDGDRLPSAGESSPPLCPPAGPVTAQGRDLYDALVAGRLGARRYVAAAAAKPGVALLGDGFEPLSEGTHCIAGLYP